MALFNCPECSKKVSDKASFCPHCGYPIKDSVGNSSHIEDSPIPEPEHITYLDSKVKRSNKHKLTSKLIEWIFTGFFIICAVIFIDSSVSTTCFLLCATLSCPLLKKSKIRLRLPLRILLIVVLFIISLYNMPDSIKADTDTKEISEETIEDSLSDNMSKEFDIEPLDSLNDNTSTAKEISGNTESIKSNHLSEDEFKSQCEEMWHDDIFFTHKSLNGKYIKAKVMVEETRFFTIDPNTILPEEYTKGIDLDENYLICGVKRVDENTYVGGTLTVYFTPDYDCYSKEIKAGNYLIIYGEVLNFDTETENGYNSCDVIAHYIERSER